MCTVSNNNTVFLLVGQRGAGKSFYARELKKVCPEIDIVSRDDALFERFGTVLFDHYGGELEYIKEVISRLLRMKLRKSSGTSLLLDYWTFTSTERQALIRELREYGAGKIIALYFITPAEIVADWFWKKPGIAKMSQMKASRDQGLVFFSEDAPVNDYRVFHKFAKGIDADGFDEVVRINPLEPRFLSDLTE